MFPRWFKLVPVLLTLFSAMRGVHATTLLLDNFEDGNATDGQPAEWFANNFPDGSRQVIDGSYVLEPGDAFEMSSVTQLTHGDFSIRTRARFLEDGSPSDFMVIFGRGTVEIVGAYWGGIANDGSLLVGVGNETLDSVSSALDPFEDDVSLQLDLVDDTLRFTAWSVNAAKPSLPQLTITNSSSLKGELVGLGFFNRPEPNSGHSPVAFREFEVVAIPEPSTIVLLAMAAAAAAFSSFRKRFLAGRESIDGIDIPAKVNGAD